MMNSRGNVSEWETLVKYWCTGHFSFALHTDFLPSTPFSVTAELTSKACNILACPLVS